MREKGWVFSKIKNVYSESKCDKVTTYVSNKKQKKEIDIAEKYYDLVTDFYEYGWGKCFHFFVQKKGEKVEEAMKRHELEVAKALKLKPGMKVLDVGCGVAGPMKNIAEASGASITGLNINAYQIKKAKEYIQKNNLEKTCDFLEGNFMNVDLPDNSFDAIYAIEATPHAPDRVKCFKEMYRLLKPGACFGGYEYAILDNFDDNNVKHLKIVENFEHGGALQKVFKLKEMRSFFEEAGFEILEFKNVFEGSEKWTEYLQKRAGGSKIKKLMHLCFVKLLEWTRFAPKGSVDVSNYLNIAAEGFIDSGKHQIFTPGVFFLVRKPV